MTSINSSQLAAQRVETDFFRRPPLGLAPALLGKVLRHRVSLGQRHAWLSARIIETEAYEITEKGSHSSLGYTEKRAALFMQPGTIYMYYARGNDSLNFSAHGEGNGVLIKSGYPVIDSISPDESIAHMTRLNPASTGPRTFERLCSGQTLLCRSLGLRVKDWDKQQLDGSRFVVCDDGYRPSEYVQCPRLGIPAGRDEHLKYRFVDSAYASQCTSNPLTKRRWQVERDYHIVKVP